MLIPFRSASAKRLRRCGRLYTAEKGAKRKPVFPALKRSCSSCPTFEDRYRNPVYSDPVSLYWGHTEQCIAKPPALCPIPTGGRPVLPARSAAADGTALPAGASAEFHPHTRLHKNCAWRNLHAGYNDTTFALSPQSRGSTADSPAQNTRPRSGRSEER